MTDDGKIRVGYWTFMGCLERKAISELPIELRRKIRDGEDISQIGLDPNMAKLLEGSQRKGWTTVRSDA